MKLNLILPSGTKDPIPKWHIGASDQPIFDPFPTERWYTIYVTGSASILHLSSDYSVILGVDYTIGGTFLHIDKKIK